MCEPTSEGAPPASQIAMQEVTDRTPYSPPTLSCLPSHHHNRKAQGALTPTPGKPLSGTCWAPRETLSFGLASAALHGTRVREAELIHTPSRKALQAFCFLLEETWPERRDGCLRGRCVTGSRKPGRKLISQAWPRGDSGSTGRAAQPGCLRQDVP